MEARGYTRCTSSTATNGPQRPVRHAHPILLQAFKERLSKLNNLASSTDHKEHIFNGLIVQQDPRPSLLAIQAQSIIYEVHCILKIIMLEAAIEECVVGLGICTTTGHLHLLQYRKSALS